MNETPRGSLNDLGLKKKIGKGKKKEERKIENGYRARHFRVV